VAVYHPEFIRRESAGKNVTPPWIFRIAAFLVVMATACRPLQTPDQANRILLGPSEYDSLTAHHFSTKW
jgi:hypothetical protein